MYPNLKSNNTIGLNKHNTIKTCYAQHLNFIHYYACSNLATFTKTRCATHLVVSEFRECVDDDTKDDVEANCGDNDEEGHIKDGFEEMVDEWLAIWYLKELGEIRNGSTHFSFKTSILQMLVLCTKPS